MQQLISYCCVVEKNAFLHITIEYYVVLILIFHEIIISSLWLFYHAICKLVIPQFRRDYHHGPCMYWSSDRSSLKIHSKSKFNQQCLAIIWITATDCGVFSVCSFKQPRAKIIKLNRNRMKSSVHFLFNKKLCTDRYRYRYKLYLHCVILSHTIYM